jgi:hypothetical protein
MGGIRSRAGARLSADAQRARARAAASKRAGRQRSACTPPWLAARETAGGRARFPVSSAGVPQPGIVIHNMEVS